MILRTSFVQDGDGNWHLSSPIDLVKLALGAARKGDIKLRSRATSRYFKRFPVLNPSVIIRNANQRGFERGSGAAYAAVVQQAASYPRPRHPRALPTPSWRLKVYFVQRGVPAARMASFRHPRAFIDIDHGPEEREG